MLIVAIATGCAVGTYYPYAQNNFGAQSKVVLDKANFRIVRDVEAIINVDNTNLSRADMANSAYGELLRKAQLTGSQVLINVVIEEVRRESGGLFRLLLGVPKRVQYVAARATIIEFLDENGNPTVSESYRPSGYQTNNTSEKTTCHPTQQIQNAQEITISSQTTQEMASTEDIEKLERANKQIEKMLSNYSNKDLYYRYKNLYNRLSFTAENVYILKQIQLILITYYTSNGNVYPNLIKQLKEASSVEEQVQVFLSYSK